MNFQLQEVNDKLDVLYEKYDLELTSVQYTHFCISYLGMVRRALYVSLILDYTPDTYEEAYITFTPSKVMINFYLGVDEFCDIEFPAWLMDTTNQGIIEYKEHCEEIKKLESQKYALEQMEELNKIKTDNTIQRVCISITKEERHQLYLTLKAEFDENSNNGQ